MSLMDILFDRADMKCTVCNTPCSIGCTCWKKCAIPGCKWSYRNTAGQKCRNPEHTHNKTMIPKKENKK